MSRPLPGSRRLRGKSIPVPRWRYAGFEEACWSRRRPATTANQAEAGDVSTQPRSIRIVLPRLCRDRDATETIALDSSRVRETPTAPSTMRSCCAWRAPSMHGSPGLDLMRVLLHTATRRNEAASLQARDRTSMRGQSRSGRGQQDLQARAIPWTMRSSTCCRIASRPGDGRSAKEGFQRPFSGFEGIRAIVDDDAGGPSGGPCTIFAERSRPACTSQGSTHLR